MKKTDLTSSVQNDRVRELREFTSGTKITVNAISETLQWLQHQAQCRAEWELHAMSDSSYWISI